jgi:hypothetical protein
VSATTSYYEFHVDPATLAAQGRAAASSGAQGLVILDFGRPAFDGSRFGMMDFSGQFVSLATVSQAAESYIGAYSTLAPRATRLTVAVGTNNSCGTGQPCGSRICGCRDEPPSFATWGAQLAGAVKQLQSWSTSFRARLRLTTTVKVVAGDDAEPVNDPAFHNTADLLRGYARAVGGYQPSMVDFGSAEPGYWTLDQLYQVAYGFRPDLPFPEIYFANDIADWTAVVKYARARYGVSMTIYGVLTDRPVGNTPQAAYTQTINAVRPLTGQTRIQWSSNIRPLAV